MVKVDNSTNHLPEQNPLHSNNEVNKSLRNAVSKGIDHFLLSITAIFSNMQSLNSKVEQKCTTALRWLKSASSSDDRLIELANTPVQVKGAIEQMHKNKATKPTMEQIKTTVKQINDLIKEGVEIKKVPLDTATQRLIDKIEDWHSS